MPVGVHLAIVDPGVGGPRRPLALRDDEGRLYVGPDNGLLLPGGETRGIEAAHELANPDVRARVDLADVPRARPLRACRRAPRDGRRASRSSGHRSIPEGLVRLDLPEPVVDRRRASRDVSLRRQLRQHRAQPRPRRRRGARDRLGHPRRARARGRALLRGHGADVRGRAARRRDPLRGQLQEDVAGDLARERGADAARLAGAGDPDHARRATRPAAAGRPTVAPPRPARRG